MKRVLHIEAGRAPADNLARARAAMESLQTGQKAESWFGVGFESLGQMLAVFTPRRLELLTVLRERGPMRVSELARTLGRNYKNVHGDVAALEQWLVIERDEGGRATVPWDEIDMRLRLVDKAA